MLHRTGYFMVSFSTKYSVSSYVSVPYGTCVQLEKIKDSSTLNVTSCVFGNWCLVVMAAAAAWDADCGCRNFHHVIETYWACKTWQQEEKNNRMKRQPPNKCQTGLFSSKNCRKSKWRNDIRPISVASVPFQIKCHSLISIPLIHIRHATQFILMRNSATDSNWHVTQLSRRRVRFIETESLWWNFQCRKIRGKSLPVASKKMRTKKVDGTMLCVNIGVLQNCATTGIMSRCRRFDFVLMMFHFSHFASPLAAFYCPFHSQHLAFALERIQCVAKCRQTSGCDVLLGVISFQMYIDNVQLLSAIWLSHNVIKLFAKSLSELFVLRGAHVSHCVRPPNSVSDRSLFGIVACLSYGCLSPHLIPCIHFGQAFIYLFVLICLLFWRYPNISQINA